MRKGVLVFLMLLLAVPVYAVQMTVAEGDAANGIKLDLGGDIRLRGYDFTNFWNFENDNDGDNWNTFRLRTRLYTRATLTDNVAGYVRISNQTYGEGVGVGQNTDENVFVDSAYIDMNNFFGMPLDLRVGRQDMMYGTGFVLFDGESDVASTAIYFDGIKLTWRITDTAKLDTFYMKDEENNRADINGDDDINLMGGYFTGHCPVIGGQQEVYLLNRTDEGNDKDIWMGGFRLSNKMECGLNYSAEAAYQWGDAYRNAAGNILDQDALGYKLEVGYALDMDGVKLRPFIGYASMSGDEDADDDDFEGWDVFYGGWPQFGDLLAWVFVNGPAQYSTAYAGTSTVVGEANYSNLNLATVGTDICVGKVKATVSYTQLTIDEEDAMTNANFESDDDYGDYYQLMMTYPYNKYLSFSLYVGAIDPGDAFPDSCDMAHEIFWETNLKF